MSGVPIPAATAAFIAAAFAFAMPFCAAFDMPPGARELPLPAPLLEPPPMPAGTRPLIPPTLFGAPCRETRVFRRRSHLKDLQQVGWETATDHGWRGYSIAIPLTSHSSTCPWQLRPWTFSCPLPGKTRAVRKHEGTNIVSSEMIRVGASEPRPGQHTQTRVIWVSLGWLHLGHGCAASLTRLLHQGLKVALLFRSL